MENGNGQVTPEPKQENNVQVNSDEGKRASRVSGLNGYLNNLDSVDKKIEALKNPQNADIRTDVLAANPELAEQYEEDKLQGVLNTAVEAALDKKAKTEADAQEALEAGEYLGNTLVEAGYTPEQISSFRSDENKDFWNQVEAQGNIDGITQKEAIENSLRVMGIVTSQEQKAVREKAQAHADGVINKSILSKSSVTPKKTMEQRVEEANAFFGTAPLRRFRNKETQ